jgi:hypothetical protein
LHLEVTTLDSPILGQLDCQEVDLVDAEPNAAYREVSLPVEPFFNNFFSKERHFVERKGGHG